MKKLNITPLEAAVLDHIVRNTYQPQNGARPDSFEDLGAVWSELIFDSSATTKTVVNPRSLPGICSSLVKKGLATCTDSGSKEAAIGLTQAGYQAWLATEGAPVVESDVLKRFLAAKVKPEAKVKASSTLEATVVAGATPNVIKTSDGRYQDAFTRKYIKKSVALAILAGGQK